MRSYFFPWS